MAQSLIAGWAKTSYAFTEERSSCDEVYPKYAFCKGSVDLCPVCMLSLVWQMSSQKTTEADEDQCFAGLTDECCYDACCQSNRDSDATRRMAHQLFECLHVCLPFALNVYAAS